MTRRHQLFGKDLLLVGDDNGHWLIAGSVAAFVADTAVTDRSRLYDSAADWPADAPIRQAIESLPAPIPAAEPSPRPLIAVIGAGPAGLMAAAAAARHLKAQSGQVTVYDPHPGGSLHLVDSITLGMVSGMAYRSSGLIDRLFAAATAAGAAIVRSAVIDLTRSHDSWLLHLSNSTLITAQSIIVATGLSGQLYKRIIRFRNVRDSVVRHEPYSNTQHIAIVTSDFPHELLDYYSQFPVTTEPIDITQLDEDRVVWHMEGTLLQSITHHDTTWTADEFIFDRSYFFPRWPGTRTPQGHALFFAGDCTNKYVGVLSALYSGQQAGLDAASACDPHANGLAWAKLTETECRS